MSELKKRGLRIVNNRIVPAKPTRSPDSCALYRHFDSAGTLLYVGVSISVLRRLQQHARGSHWLDRVETIKVQRFPTVAEALEAEAAAIRDEKPLYNIKGNDSTSWDWGNEEEDRAEMAKLERVLAKHE